MRIGWKPPTGRIPLTMWMHQQPHSAPRIGSATQPMSPTPVMKISRGSFPRSHPPLLPSQTARHFQRDTRFETTRICFQSSIWGMRDMEMQKRSWPARRSITWIWWGHRRKSIDGRPESTMALPRSMSPSMGTPSRLAVHQGKPAAVGPLPGRALRRCSPSRVGLQRAGAARCEITGRTRDSEPSRDGGMRLPCTLHDSASRRKHSSHSLLRVQALKEFMRKPFVEWVDVDHGLLVSHVPTSSISFLQRHALCVESMTGTLESHHM